MLNRDILINFAEVNHFFPAAPVLVSAERAGNLDMDLAIWQIHRRLR